MCTAAVRSEWVFYSKFVLRILLSAVSYVLVGMMGRWLCVCAFLLVACESVRARARKIRLGGWVCVCVGRSFWLSSPPPPPLLSRLQAPAASGNTADTPNGRGAMYNITQGCT